MNTAPRSIAEVYILAEDEAARLGVAMASTSERKPARSGDGARARARRVRRRTRTAGVSGRASVVGQEPERVAACAWHGMAYMCVCRDEGGVRGE